MGARLSEIADREVAHADVPDLARAVERFEGLHRLPQRHLAPRIRPVHLVKVDLANAEALQARGARLLHVVAPEVPSADFRGDEHMITADVLDRLRHHFLGMAVPVRLRGIDQVDPEFHGALHRTLAIRIADVAAPGFPARLPHSDADFGDLRTAATQRNVVHAKPRAADAPESQKPIEARGRTIPADGRGGGTARMTCCTCRASDPTPIFPSGTPSRTRASFSIRSRP